MVIQAKMVSPRRQSLVISTKVTDDDDVNNNNNNNPVHLNFQRRNSFSSFVEKRRGSLITRYCFFF